MLAAIKNKLGNSDTDSISTARLTLYIALAYLLLGALGLMLAIGPGYASPIFPACGLALAVALLFRRRAFSGIWLGSFVLNIMTALLHGPLTQTNIALALLIASGSTAQAWLGSWMVTHWQRSAWRNLERELDALIFMLLGGVLSCLLAASVGVSGLYAANLINRADFIYSWWNWYVGDTLGVLIFAPFPLRLLNRSANKWDNQHRYSFVSILLMTSLLWLAFYGTAHLIKIDREYHLKSDCEDVAKRISDRLLTHREVLNSLHNFIEATPEFSFKQFELFTKITLEDNPDIFALSFNDLVTNGSRPAFEHTMSGMSPLGRFQITERDSERRLIRAATRDEYVAVRYIVPLANNQPAVGFDINSEPIRRDAINRARAANNMAVTMPLQLVQEEKTRVGVLELMPVEEIPAIGGAEHAAPRILGFAVSVIKVDEMIEIATSGHVPGGLQFRVTDLKAPKGKELLYLSDTGSSINISSERKSDWKTGLHVGGRDWEFSAYTADVYLQQQRPLIAWGMGGIAIIITGLMQLLVVGMAGRVNEIRRTNDAVSAYLDNLFNFANVPIIVWDCNFKITRFSRAFEPLIGRTAEEMVTQDIAIIFPLGDVEHSMELINKTASGERLESVEFPIIHINGTVSTVLLNSSPIFGEDGITPVATIAQGHDITARKQIEIELQHRTYELGDTNAQLEQEIAERKVVQEKLAVNQTQLESVNSSLQQRIDNAISELRQRDQLMITQGRQAAMGEMIGNIAHQWRQPLNALAMVLGNIKSAYQYNELTDGYLDETVENGNRLIQKMSTTINDFRNFFLPDKQMVAFSAHNQINHAVSLMEAGLTSQNISIHMEAEQDITLTGFPNEYSQVLLNLLTNSRDAIKASNAAEGHITIRLKEQGGNGYVSICDNGGGIPVDVIDKVFEPYFSTKEMGTGIGLYMSKMIIERSMNGTIEVHNIEGGTEFVVITPLKMKLS